MGTIGHIRSLYLTFNIFNLECLILPVASKQCGHTKHPGLKSNPCRKCEYNLFILLMFTDQVYEYKCTNTMYNIVQEQLYLSIALYLRIYSW